MVQQSEYDDSDDDVPIIGPSRVGPEPKDIEEIMKVLESTPLFMRSLKDEDVEDNVVLSALQSLVFDGTAEEQALNFKNHGNDSFKDGPKFYRTALDYYTKGIEAGANDDDLNSILYSNRAAVHLELKNYRKAINDCASAIKFCKKNIKAYYRSIKALFAVERYEEAIDACNWALQVEPANRAIMEEKAKIAKRMNEIEDLARTKKEQEDAAAAKDKALVDAITARGVKMVSSKVLEKKRKSDDDDDDEGHASARTGTLMGHRSEALKESLLASHNPAIADDGRLTFPVLFLYPEFSESDLISAFHEDDAFIDHLETMFGADVPRPGWDTAGLYTPSTIEVYFETRPDLDLDDKTARRLLKINKEGRLGDVISHPDFRLVDGIATFLLTGASYGKTLRKKYKNK